MGPMSGQHRRGACSTVTFPLGVTILRSRTAVTININRRTSTSPRDSRPYVKIILNRGNNGIRWQHHSGFGGLARHQTSRRSRGPESDGRGRAVVKAFYSRVSSDLLNPRLGGVCYIIPEKPGTGSTPTLDLPPGQRPRSRSPPSGSGRSAEPADSLRMGEAHLLRHPAHRARVLGHSVYVAGELSASAGFPDQGNNFPDGSI